MSDQRIWNFIGLKVRRRRSRSDHAFARLCCNGAQAEGDQRVKCEAGYFGGGALDKVASPRGSRGLLYKQQRAFRPVFSRHRIG